MILCTLIATILPVDAQTGPLQIKVVYSEGGRQVSRQVNLGDDFEWTFLTPRSQVMMCAVSRSGQYDPNGVEITCGALMNSRRLTVASARGVVGRNVTQMLGLTYGIPASHGGGTELVMAMCDDRRDNRCRAR